MSTTPLATIFHGDVTLETGNDVTQFGWGDINISRRCVINGNENSTCNTDGSLIVAGGAGITKTLNVHENLNVLYGITRLAEHILIRVMVHLQLLVVIQLLYKLAIQHNSLAQVEMLM